MSKVVALDIEQIRIGENRRPIKDAKVAELIQSIQANGLLNPITVDQKFNLVAGLHRLTACKLLGSKEIECNVINCSDADGARLAEIDENFVRSELEPLERYELWLERDRILERMGLRAKPGDNQYSRSGGEFISPPPKTTLELAQSLGYSERSFQQGKQIAKDIHPEVKREIVGSSLAKSRTIQLQIARAAAAERMAAEIAEKALELAIQAENHQEAEEQAQLATQARERQKQIQIETLQGAISRKGRRGEGKRGGGEEEGEGEEWVLGRHLVYCGDTASGDFIKKLPGHAALAIATLTQSPWRHDYLVKEARIVAVLRSAGNIYEFFNCQKMPFQYEFIIDDVYVGIFSQQSIPKPQGKINIGGVEGIISYLLGTYTQPNNYVIAPFMGNGEVLLGCDRMSRICFTGDKNPQLVKGGIERYQKFGNKRE
ncbi:ParB/RepB/Spo0J family partition protein [Calothrix sp. PCC 6303]|uniref:ParB/RepB/Spo0J family partition protein n=1 Tax=Calothrix sp. PCC 6303 TaxID=1170562 RepID=UPI0002A01D09|nr:ParB N-terminal domain-containing protein [Calothrix sp. PCC 6303]AFZ00752.1 ParB domain protein nuclease [Calothrix sp. PCC 6303]